jgi:hypothetical protein
VVLRLGAAEQVRLEAIFEGSGTNPRRATSTPTAEPLSVCARLATQNRFATGLGHSPQFEHPTQVQFVLYEASRRVTANLTARS